MMCPVRDDVACARSLVAGAPSSKRHRQAAPLPSLCDDLVGRIRREGRQLSERLNVVYHIQRYTHMCKRIKGMRTSQSELGRLLRWIYWERMWSAAGSDAPFYLGDTIRRALDGVRSEDKQREMDDY